MQKVYNEYYKKPIVTPQPPVAHTVYDRIKKSVLIPQPPAIQMVQRQRV